MQGYFDLSISAFLWRSDYVPAVLQFSSGPKQKRQVGSAQPFQDYTHHRCDGLVNYIYSTESTFDQMLQDT
ncbi:Protein of unknown function [Pyronema omphalodes CBS 100304]|uniref:Uncharacterized protein n=1 Tax=Pyronema omphalodes (strain CBS 100304) TaxID=1076935 RepID=U4LSU1_PYROM|nr:Protein of unknown function [Pyronema omphalodes CBS 100304]